MSGRPEGAAFPADFRCEYAERGRRTCPAWRCDCLAWLPEPEHTCLPDEGAPGPAWTCPTCGLVWWRIDPV